MKRYALDANCFIDAANPSSSSHTAMHRIFQAAARGELELSVSLHTLHELEARKDEAWDWRGLRLNCPIGLLVVGRSKSEPGSNRREPGMIGRRNDEIQTELKSLAKSGTDIRDRGGYIDALRNGLDGFVTSDKQIVGNGPSGRINGRFQTRYGHRSSYQKNSDSYDVDGILEMAQITPSDCGSI